MGEEAVNQLRKQIRAEAVRRQEQLREGMEQARHQMAEMYPEVADQASFETMMRRKLESEIEEQMSFAIEVWEEGGRQLPLNEDQLVSVSMRASHAHAVALKEKLERNLGRVTPGKRLFAAAMLQVFKRQNARMAAFRNVADLKEGDLENLAQGIASELQDVTERAQRGEFRAEEDA